MGVKRIPVKAAREVARLYGQDQIIMVSWDRSKNLTHVVTYGTTRKDCMSAAQGGNIMKRALGWPEEKCHAAPARARL